MSRRSLSAGMNCTAFASVVLASSRSQPVTPVLLLKYGNKQRVEAYRLMLDVSVWINLNTCMKHKKATGGAPFAAWRLYHHHILLQLLPSRLITIFCFRFLAARAVALHDRPHACMPRQYVSQVYGE